MGGEVRVLNFRNRSDWMVHEISLVEIRESLGLLMIELLFPWYYLVF